jgi:predicted O-methyltransferase YrrM
MGKTLVIAGRGEMAIINIPGGYEPKELKLLQSFIQKLDCEGVILEIGTAVGRSFVNMAIATDRQMVSIDPHIRGADWYGPSGGSLEWLKKNIKHYNLEDRTEIIVDCSENVKWDGRKIAFLHIDGAHDYEHVSYDFCHFQQYIPKGGYVAFHDNKLKYLLDVNRVVVDEVPLFGFELAGREGQTIIFQRRKK